MSAEAAGAEPLRYKAVAAMVRGQLAAGQWEAWREGPSIGALAAQTGYARRTIAKALGVLEAEGLLARYPGLGYIATGGQE